MQYVHLLHELMHILGGKKPAAITQVQNVPGCHHAYFDELCEKESFDIPLFKFHR